MNITYFQKASITMGRKPIKGNSFIADKNISEDDQNNPGEISRVITV